LTDVLDKGFVNLVDVMGDDTAIVNAARVSTIYLEAQDRYVPAPAKTPEQDAKLIDYLMRNRHTSPFEMVEFKFHVSLPIFVARQWIRHRMASYNEFSGRYSVLPDKFYYPSQDGAWAQSLTNKQGSDGAVSAEDVDWFLTTLLKWCEAGYHAYKEALERGFSKERARFFIANTVYTQWYWKVDLKNLLDFCRLRTDAHAQWEIQEYARAVLALIQPSVPVTIAAWEKAGRP